MLARNRTSSRMVHTALRRFFHIEKCNLIADLPLYKVSIMNAFGDAVSAAAEIVFPPALPFAHSTAVGDKQMLGSTLWSTRPVASRGLSRI